MLRGSVCTLIILFKIYTLFYVYAIYIYMCDIYIYTVHVCKCLFLYKEVTRKREYGTSIPTY